MADAEDDEQFLYGDEPQDKGQSGTDGKSTEAPKTEKTETTEAKDMEPTENGAVAVKEEDDAKEAGELTSKTSRLLSRLGPSLRVIQTFSMIKICAPYATPVNWNFKGGAAASKATPGAGSKTVDVNAEGTVNGVGIYEYDLESSEEKPWRQPGADITDYFNYGFTEDTWKQYCEKQRRMRMDLSMQKKIFSHHVAPTVGGPIDMPGMMPMDGRGPRKAGPPPERKLEGSIDVIGAVGSRVESRRHDEDVPPHMMGDDVPPDMMHGRGMGKRFPPGGPGGPGMPPGGPPPFPPTSDPNMGHHPPISGPPTTSMSGPPIPVHHGMPPQYGPGRRDMPPPGAPPGMLPPGMPPHGMPPGFGPDQAHMQFEAMGFPGRGGGGMRGRGRGFPGMPGMPTPGEFPPGMDERGPRMGFEEGMQPFFPGVHYNSHSWKPLASLSVMINS
ncbi:predicted protein [Nematostella vectensis]|uniref:Pre-mRNA polyadenylation factor Fip1 domain-containing protein n=1 Tax=Nematostella vectensis TaxID=45351 RepID=A7SNL6_NEMVE|nr:predicted protein [Nematostella vectensis]|eukprot:XP_001626777.1 predicted protein [Nematostella vectensis]